MSPLRRLLFWASQPWPARGMAVLVAGVLTLVLLQLAPGARVTSEEALSDLTWRVAAQERTEQRLVVVDIDEAAVRQEGAWPWPRSTMARLAQRLAEAGAAVQVYDIAFPEAKPGDAELAAAWAGQPVVLAQIFSLDQNTTPRLGSVAGAAGAQCPSVAPRSFGVVGNSAGLFAAPGPAGAAGATAAFAPPVAGHITPHVEHDGVVRKLPALICHEGRPYTTLSLAALSRLTGPGRLDWQVQRGAGWLAPAYVAATPAMPGLQVPLDGNGDLRVPYRTARQALRSVSAADVISGKADASLLRGAVVLVGATAFGIGDVVATPLASVSSGVEVHAQLLASMLDGRLIHTPASAPALEVLAALLGAALLLAVLARRRSAAGGAGGAAGSSREPVKTLPLVAAVLALALAATAALLQAQGGLWLSWAGAALFLLLAGTALAAVEHALTRAQRERLSAHLGAYLPAPMAERLAALDPSGHLQVERREVTVMVADIRNFSSFALHRPPEQTAAVLHAFSCLAVEVIERHGGVVENLVGDSVVAMWNAYGPQAETAVASQQALLAARELLAQATPLLASATDGSLQAGAGGAVPAAAPADLSDALDNAADAFESAAVQPLALGLGMESGSAIVGSFGPARRRAHAALGEPVTVAVRLQAMTQDLSLPILIGPRMAASLPAGATLSQGEYLLEGLSRHVELHAPSAWTDWAPADTVFGGRPRSGAAASAAPGSVGAALGEALNRSTSPLLPAGSTIQRSLRDL